MAARRGSRRFPSTRLGRISSALGGLLAIVLTCAVGAGVSANPAGADTPRTGPASGVSPSAASGPLRWTGPRLIDPPQGDAIAVSCPVVDFCVAVDRRNAFVFRNRRWSQPFFLNPGLHPSGPRKGSLSGVSCASARFCLAIDDVGNGYRFDGHRWRPPVKLGDADLLAVSCVAVERCLVNDGYERVLTVVGTRVVAIADFAVDFSELTAVSCASVVFCVVIDRNGGARTYNGRSWSVRTRVFARLPTGVGGARPSLSCASAAFCLLSTIGYPVFEFNGNSWNVAPPGGPESASASEISCASSKACVGVSAPDGVAYAFDGTTWSAPTRLDVGSGDFRAVSCATGSECVVLDDQGQAIVRHDGIWAAPFAFDPRRGSVASVSCPSVQSCVVVDYSGQVLHSNGRSWSKPSMLVPDSPVTALSCASRRFCVTTDQGGNAYVYDGRTWDGPIPAIPASPYYGLSLSCPSPTFCAAVDWAGVYTWKAGVFAAPVPLTASAVSCASETFCALLGSSQAFMFDGSRWLGPVRVPLSLGYPVVSCPTATFCLAVDYWGSASIFDGTKWSEAVPTGLNSVDPTAVSCSSADLCTVVTDHGDAVTWRDGAWTEPVSIDPASQGLISVSCVGPSFCTAVDRNGFVFVGR